MVPQVGMVSLPPLKTSTNLGAKQTMQTFSKVFQKGELLHCFEEDDGLWRSDFVTEMQQKRTNSPWGFSVISLFNFSV